MIDASEYCRNKKQKTSTKTPKDYMVTFLFLYISHLYFLVSYSKNAILQIFEYLSQKSDDDE